MKAGPSKTVVFDYQLYNKDGELMESSGEGNPLSFVFGGGTIIPGLEKGLEGLEPGDTREIVVEPEEAYGVRDPNLVQHVPRDRFPEGFGFEEGMSYSATTDGGDNVSFLVVNQDNENVEIDLNHPLAGETLRFEVIIRDVQYVEA
ncbi:MAG: peptidylprolyl isomerase [Actinomycetota bacterium]|nr:peptidylprolyl isomerase [Actinomycetota bacterium]